MNQEPIFNFDDALARVDQDYEIFQAMAELFIEQGPKDLADTRAALTARNGVALARCAHRLKGAILQFCAPAVLDAIRELEELGKAGDLDRGMEAYRRVESELRRLLGALHDQLAQRMPS